MKELAIILLLTVTYCSCLPPNIIEVREEHESFMDKKLRTKLEQLREDMKKGISFLNNQILDPLSIVSDTFTFEHEDLISAGVTVEDFLLLNASSYDVKTAKLAMGDFKVSVGLFWPELHLNTKYDLLGTIAKKYEIYGNGKLSINVTNLDFFVKIHVIVGEEHIQIEINESAINLKDFQFKITGLFDDEEISDFLSSIVTNMVPDLLDNYQSVLADKFNEYAAIFVNKQLMNVDLDTIMNIIMSS